MTASVSATDRISDHTRQPGKKRNCARCPPRLEMMNTGGGYPPSAAPNPSSFRSVMAGRRGTINTGKFVVRIVARTDRGRRVVSTRTYTDCRKGPPTTRVER